MSQIITKSRQSIFDLALEQYGKAESGWSIWISNLDTFLQQSLEIASGEIFPAELPMELSEELISGQDFPGSPIRTGTTLEISATAFATSPRTVTFINQRTLGISTGFNTEDPSLELPPLPLSASITAINFETAKGGDGAIYIAVAGGTKPYTFEWIDLDSLTEGILSTSQNLIGVSSGSYQVTIYDAGGFQIILTGIVLGVADTNTYIADKLSGDGQEVKTILIDETAGLIKSNKS